MEQELALRDSGEALVLLGSRDRNLRLIRKRFGVHVSARHNRLRLEGEEQAVEDAARLMKTLLDEIREGSLATPGDVEEAIDVAAQTTSPEFDQCSGVLLQSAAQKRYVHAIRCKDLVVCTGPAGTGKTFLAVCAAVESLRAGAAKKIILVRPAVEAGERLGFLPGDFQAKINPYLRPLYDALNEILDFEQVRRYLERDVIEIVPLAYMRGRTLNQAFIILDEAQNCTPSQMKMFLTRMGMGSKIVCTGDTTQVDLEGGARSGLTHMQKLLRGVEGIAFLAMSKADIVRHPLVKKIVAAYERNG